MTTLVLSSRAWAQEPTPAIPAFPDSSGCLDARITTAAPGDPARDSTRVPASTTGVASQAPAIILFASASAREVRFASPPRIHVRLCGGVVDSVRVLERRNLPDPVQPGVTYRDVFIAVEILGHLNAQCLASRITRDSRLSGACAAIQVRDTAGAVRRSPP